MRSLARLLAARSGNTSSPPAMPISSLTQRIALIAGSSHSSKYTRGRRGSVAALDAHRVEMRCSDRTYGLRAVARADHGAQAQHVAEDLLDRAVVGHPHLDAGLDQRLRDVGLHVGKADRQVGLQLEDPIDLGAGEGADLGLLLPRARRAHREARDADDAALLAQRVQHLGGLFGQADDAFGQRGHATSLRAQRNGESGSALNCLSSGL